MKRILILIALPFILSAATVMAQDKMEVKDADSNLLMQVNDEGDAGSLSLPGLTAAPSVFANKLYNIGGVLFFNGTPLSSLWSQNSGNIFFDTGNVGIGLSTAPVSALQVNGTITATTFVGDGSGLTNLPPGNGWSLTGNAGTVAGTNFVGTTDNIPLDFRVNNARVLRLEYATEEGGEITPNMIGGFSGNTVTGNGSVIVGGGIEGDVNTVLGTFAAIVGGIDNTVNGQHSFIGGGRHNTAGAVAVVGGGSSNQASGNYSVVLGGIENLATGNASTVAGGSNNSASGTGSFAAGRRAKANHDVTFVWGDNTNADFTSTAGNQFLIRAGNGVGINKNDPATALDVAGTVTATAFIGDGSGLTGISGDDLGNHTATQTLDLSNNDISNGGMVTATSFVGDGSGLTGITGDDLGNHTATQTLDLANNDITNGGTVTATDFVGDGSGLTGISGDNLGNHTATQALDLNNNDVSNGGTVTANAFVGDGSGLTNLPPSPDPSGWSLTGNAGTVDGTNFIGTTDDVALDFRVNNERGLRLEYATDFSGNPAPNIIGGFSGNTIGAGAFSATISGGGSTGLTNSVTSSGAYATIVGGFGNTASNERATIAGGSVSTVSGRSGTVVGGESHTVSGEGATVVGGINNTASGVGATVVGGEENLASGIYSLAAGLAAKALHNGTFVWNGDQDGDSFSSTAAQQFLINANVGIGTNDPSETLHVNGNALANAHTTPSSRRWKTNIKTIDNALATVQQLRGVTYDWKESGKHDIGLIAEEVGAIIPEIVEYEENGIDAKSVDYPRLVAVLIEAVKELKQENDVLKSQNSAFEKRFTRIEAALGKMTDSGDIKLTSLK